jgi:hypothetical protein
MAATAFIFRLLIFIGNTGSRPRPSKASPIPVVSRTTVATDYPSPVTIIAPLVKILIVVAPVKIPIVMAVVAVAIITTMVIIGRCRSWH